jgi:hypothetical protein
VRKESFGQKKVLLKKDLWRKRMKNKYFDLLEIVMDEYEKEGYEPELLGQDLVTVTQWSEYGFYYTKDGQRKCRQDRQAAYKRLISCEHGHELLRMEKKMVQQGW